MPVDILIEPGWDSIPLSRLQTFAEQILTALNESESELSISLVDDKTVRILNYQYRRIDAATDVLSFSQREGERIGSTELLGDIIISIETASRQAQELGHTLEEELMELIFHGCLHLLGLDHEQSMDRWVKVEASVQQALKQLHFWFIPQGLSPKEKERTL